MTYGKTHRTIFTLNFREVADMSRNDNTHRSHLRLQADKFKKRLDALVDHLDRSDLRLQWELVSQLDRVFTVLSCNMEQKYLVSTLIAIHETDGGKRSGLSDCNN